MELQCPAPALIAFTLGISGKQHFPASGCSWFYTCPQSCSAALMWAEHGVSSDSKGQIPMQMCAEHSHSPEHAGAFGAGTAVPAGAAKHSCK